MRERESGILKKEREPRIFKNWDVYTRQRQVMASAVVFKRYGWHEWKIGHAKLYGILLWHYEMKKHTSFKYRNLLHKLGYQRTHNYRLLKQIVENEVLQKEGNGRYSFGPSEVRVIENVLSIITKLDMIGNETEVE